MEIHLKLFINWERGVCKQRSEELMGTGSFIMWFSGFKLTSGLAASIFTHCSILLENLFFFKLHALIYSSQYQRIFNWVRFYLSWNI